MTVQPVAQSVAGVRRSGEPPEAGPLPVLPALRGLLPAGLPRGQVVAVDGVGALPLALVAGVVPAGEPAADRWCALVGVPEAGVLAAVGMGADPDRLLLVDEPGERWPDVVATLLPAVEAVLLRPPSPPPAGVSRRLAALARRHGTALLVAGFWEGAYLRMRVATSVWTGLADGHGRLRDRRVKVVAEGRGAGGRPRASWLWLPAADGSVAGADLTDVPVGGADLTAVPAARPVPRCRLHLEVAG